MRICIKVFFVLNILIFWPLHDCVSKSLEDILKKHIDAIGGHEAINHLNSTVAYSSVIFGGLTGKQVVQFKSPFKIQIFQDFGVMSLQLGFDGKTAWSVDPNGMVKKDIPDEMKALVNELYFGSFSYALPRGHPGEREYRGDTSIAGLEYHHIAFFPDGGDSVNIYINTETGLIDYRSELIAGLKMVTQYSDYRNVSGIKMSFEAISNSPDGPIQISTRLDSVKVNNDIPDNIFNLPGEAAIDFKFPAAARLIEVPFEHTYGYLTVMVKINGQGPFNFILDTGAGMTILSKTTAEMLGLNISGEIPIRGIGGFGSVGFVEIESIEVGDLPIYIRRVLVNDFQSMGGRMFTWIDGIIGYDFFARFLLNLDMNRSTMTIYNPDYPKPELPENSIDIEVYAHVPVMESFVNGQSIQTLIDLGAQPGLAIRTDIPGYDKSDFESIEQSQEVAIMGVGGKTPVGSGLVDSLRMGSHLLVKPRAIFLDDFSHFPFPEYIEGIVGLDILAKFEIYLDYPGKKVYLINGGFK